MGSEAWVWVGMSTIAVRSTPPLRARLRKRYIAFVRRWTPIRKYVVSAGHEWAVIYIDEREGSFSCQSTFGTYAFIWRAIGDRTLKQFLCGLNFEYFMGKTRPGYMRFDEERSTAWLKDYIIRARREGSLDKGEARKAFNELEWLSPDGEHMYASSLYDSPGIMHALANDPAGCIQYAADGNSRGFWKIIWPAFLDHIGGRKQ